MEKNRVHKKKSLSVLTSEFFDANFHSRVYTPVLSNKSSKTPYETALGPKNTSEHKRRSHSSINKCSPISRTKLVSDEYFESKFSKTSKGLKLLKDKLKRLPKTKNLFFVQRIHLILNEIIRNIDQISKNYRKEERLIYQCLLYIIYENSKENIENKEIVNILTSAKTVKALKTFIGLMKSETFDKDSKKNRVHKASVLYSSINCTFYGYQLTKTIDKFLLLMFEFYEIKVKNIRFIDYFNETESIEFEESKVIKEKKSENTIVTSEALYDTTKEDEEWFNALDDESCINENIESFDARTELTSKFFLNNKAVNPYKTFELRSKNPECPGGELIKQNINQKNKKWENFKMKIYQNHLNQS